MLTTEMYQGILPLAILSNRKSFKGNVKEILPLKKKKDKSNKVVKVISKRILKYILHGICRIY